MRIDGKILCWGAGWEPDENRGFVSVDAGNWECGLMSNGSGRCWSILDEPAPSGRLTSISAGDGWNQACALRESGSVVCWIDEDAQQDRPDENERFLAVGAGDDFACALRMDRSPVCWGLDNKWKTAAPNNEHFFFLNVGRTHACGLRKHGTAVCWDEDGVLDQSDFKGAPPQEQQFTHVSVGSYFACGVKVDDTVLCWGNDSEGETSPPRQVRLDISTPPQPDAGVPAHLGHYPIERSVVRVKIPTGEYSASTGSGVIASVDRGTGAAYVLTANHVIDERPRGVVVVAESESTIREYEATVIQADATRDVALLSICCSDSFQAAELSEGLPPEGAAVFAVGFPDGSQRVITSSGRVISTMFEETIVGIHIGADVDVEEGSSGGPLVSEAGEVVGIVRAAISRYRPPGISEEDRQAFLALLDLWEDGTAVAVSSQTIIQALGPFPWE